jgi:predicted transcriptional regulator
VTFPVLAIETGGYVVQPAYDLYPEYSDLYFTPRSEETVLLNDPVPETINLSDLPLWILVVLGVTAVSSVIICLCKCFSSSGLFLIGGFKRVSRKNILKNPSRSEIYNYVKENPGVQMADIGKCTGNTYKNLVYHLDLLIGFGMITMMKCKNTVRYFENSGSFSDAERKMIMHLKHGSDKKIIEAVLNHRGISRHEISSYAGISGPSVSWHMHFLVDDQIIVQEKEGTITRHYLTGPMIEVYEDVIRWVY